MTKVSVPRKVTEGLHLDGMVWFVGIVRVICLIWFGGLDWIVGYDLYGLVYNVLVNLYDQENWFC
jgi:hypothetical protein